MNRRVQLLLINTHCNIREKVLKKQELFVLHWCPLLTPNEKFFYLSLLNLKPKPLLVTGCIAHQYLDYNPVHMHT